MATPMILELLNNLKTRVATNETNIATNTATIAQNRQDFDTHAANDTRHWTTTDRQNFDRVVHFKGYFTTKAKLEQAYPTAQVGDYAIVGATDTVWAWDDTTNKWLNTTEQGVVITVNGRTGEVVLTKTDVGLSNVDNTSDINKPISTAQQAALDNKAHRKKITTSEVDSSTLRAGIYDLYNISRTILGFTAKYWTVIVGENNSTTSATQIWMNYDSGTVPHMYIRHQTSSGTAWTEFKEVMTNTDFTNLQNQITANDTDISNLQSDKADRKAITLEQADSLDLKAGIYGINNQSKTILGFTSSYWNVYIASHPSNGSKSGSQIWFNIMTNEVPHMYIRHQKNDAASWSDFVEIYTTSHFSTTDLNRFKQYKGYFESYSALNTAYATANNGDYAIVGSVLYIWDSRATKWVQVSGSGSTGTGKWSIRRYSGITERVTPDFSYLTGKTLEKQWEVEDTDGYFFKEYVIDHRFFLIETFVNMQVDTDITTSSAQSDDGIRVYINNQSIYSSSAEASGISLTLNFKQGWNKIQIIVQEISGSEIFKLGAKISSNTNCISMDCYHSEPESTLGYVPLRGDSTIVGSLTTTGDLQADGVVKITENSYLQYNESDKSLSFMFN